MVGLGVLRKAGGRFALRSPNVLLLMGGPEEISDALVRHREPPLEQIDPTYFRSPLNRNGQSALERRSPLTASQEAELRRPTNEVIILFGTNAAGLSELREALIQSIGLEYFREPTQVGPDPIRSSLDSLADRQRDGTTVLFIGPEAAWAVKQVEQALKKVDSLTSDKQHARVVFTADPARTMQLAKEPAVIQVLSSAGVRFMSLEPWQDPAVRQWLEDCQFGPTDQGGRNTIRAVTGNWPWLLVELHRRFQSESGSWTDHLLRLDIDMKGKPLGSETAKALGLIVPGAVAVLKHLADYGTLTEKDLVEVVEDTVNVAVVLRWAEFLRLADQVENGWRLDSVVERLLKSEGI